MDLFDRSVATLPVHVPLPRRDRAHHGVTLRCQADADAPFPDPRAARKSVSLTSEEGDWLLARRPVGPERHPGVQVPERGGSVYGVQILSLGIARCRSWNG